MAETLVKVSSVGIKYSLHYEPESGREGNPFFRFKRRRRKEFWALKNISFETSRGEIFGIIGANGAGKSTLLKIIAGIIPSSEGRVSVTGTLAPFIELGAAFNADLTGAENIFLAGSIYKVPKKEVRSSFNQIVDFAELRNFIDTPVKNYSSGMFVRLAFSIILFFRPEIVLIDEVFSVGDEAFQQKSFEKIFSFRNTGASIIIVSHDSQLLNQMCDRILVLDRGTMAFLGPPKEAVDFYHRLLRRGEGLDADARLEKQAGPAAVSETRRWGNKKVLLTSVRFVDDRGQAKDAFYQGDYFEAQIAYVSHLEKTTPVLGVAIDTIYKLLIYGPNTLEASLSKKIGRRGVLRFIIPSLPLLEGDYLFSAAAYDWTLQTAYDHHQQMYHFRVLRRGGRTFGCVKIDCRWDIRKD
jgi:ABC-type polysaccharide/polyol phosphate transport system ATPase subunit